MMDAFYTSILEVNLFTRSSMVLVHLNYIRIQTSRYLPPPPYSSVFPVSGSLLSRILSTIPISKASCAPMK